MLAAAACADDKKRASRAWIRDRPESRSGRPITSAPPPPLQRHSSGNPNIRVWRHAKCGPARNKGYDWKKAEEEDSDLLLISAVAPCHSQRERESRPLWPVARVCVCVYIMCVCVRGRSECMTRIEICSSPRGRLKLKERREYFWIGGISGRFRASARDRQCVCVLRDFGDFLERESGYKCMYDGRGNRCREKRARLLHGNGVVFSFMKSLC